MANYSYLTSESKEDEPAKETDRRKKYIKKLLFEKNPELKTTKHQILYNRSEVLIDGVRVPFFSNQVHKIKQYYLHYPKND